MEENLTSTRWSFIHPSHADIPRPFHLLLNTLAAIGMALPYLMILLPCFGIVWVAVTFQSVFVDAAYGAISAVMSIVKIAATFCSVEMLRISYSIRRDWEDELRRIIHDACEEFLQPWLR